MTKLVKITLTLGFSLLGAPGFVAAHPVAYEGATAVQFFSDNQMREFQTYYSPSPRVSIGGRYLNFDLPDRKSDVILGGANFLVNRWNAADSQANLYLGAAFGGEIRSPTFRRMSLFELNADWESRKLYLATQTRALPSSGSDTLYSSYARFGFSPYVAEYGSVHTWLILEVARMTHSGMGTQVTPLVRLFHKNVLIEIGRSLDNNWKFNFMVHL